MPELEDWKRHSKEFNKTDAKLICNDVMYWEREKKSANKWMWESKQKKKNRCEPRT